MAGPLPSGWEARYDPNYKRYFYIDHSTKKTQWEPPVVPTSGFGLTIPKAASQSQTQQYQQMPQYPQMQQQYQRVQQNYPQQQQIQQQHVQPQTLLRQPVQPFTSGGSLSQQYPQMQQQYQKVQQNYPQQQQIQQQHVQAQTLLGQPVQPFTSGGLPLQEVSKTQNQYKPTQMVTVAGASSSSGISTSTGYRSNASNAPKPGMSSSKDVNSDISDAQQNELLRQLKNQLDLYGVLDAAIIETLAAGNYDLALTISIFEGMGFTKKGEQKTSSSASRFEEEEKKAKLEAEKRRKEKEEVKKKEEEKKEKEIRKKEQEKLQKDVETEARVKEEEARKKEEEIRNKEVERQASENLKKMENKNMSLTVGNTVQTFGSLNNKGSSYSTVSSATNSNLLNKLVYSGNANYFNNSFLKSAVTSKDDATYQLQKKITAVGSDPTLLSENRIQTKGGDISLVAGPLQRLDNGKVKSLAKGSLVEPVGSGMIAKGPDSSLLQNKFTLAKGVQRAV
ncbi:DNA ligase 1 isoform X3 [Hydra vulgaris]|uniref:DNA ligase 1 isoform X3 n=1 Tax=Hydra vulgaris TaxID=6087 RepID=UPI0032EA3AEC